MLPLSAIVSSVSYLLHVKMDTAKQHWEILQEIGTDLANKVRSFMVIGKEGDGVLVATEDGQGFWLGTMKFESESRTATKPTPLDVPELLHMAHCSNHILLLNKRGEVYSMGQNDRGQLGLGTVDKNTRFLPKLISSPHKFISVRCGKGHSLALTEDGKVWAWGSNLSGQVGVPSSTVSLPSPRQIPELDSHLVVAVECGGYHSLALTDQGEVYAWGSNRWGQLGGGILRLSIHEIEMPIPIQKPTPTRIDTPSPVKSMAAGYRHTLLLTHNGRVYACGDNRWGQLAFSTCTEYSRRLCLVTRLHLITSQIASHPATNLSIAMSPDQRCFVWGQLNSGKLYEEEGVEKKELYIKMFTPRKLPRVYSTLESPLSFFFTEHSTPHSIQISETPPSRVITRLSRMFDNPETSDVQFVVEQRTIHAHLNILSNFSDYFTLMFSERWLAPVDLEDPIVKVTILDHTYETFHAFLRFIYTDCLEVHFDLLPELFDLASQYLESDLQQLCLSRMRSTITTTTCCLYYPLTHRYSLPELTTFQQELVKFASTRMSEVVNTVAYQSMEPDLRDNLTNAAQNFPSSYANSISKLFKK